MRFSIVIPVYNVAGYIDQCLRSVSSQGFKDYEVILVNDGSTDQSAEICKEFISKGVCKSRLINQDNSGLLSARRAGISEACGEYIISLDGDDALRADALELIDDCIGETQSDVVIFGYSRKRDFSQAVSPTLVGGRTYSGNEARREFCKTNRLNSMWGKAVARSVVGQSVDFSRFGRLNMGEDALQSLVIFDKASTITCLDVPLYYYRPNASSISSCVGLSYLDDMEIVHDEVLGYAEKWDDELGENACAAFAISRCAEEIVHFALHYPEGLSFDEARDGLCRAAHSKAISSFKVNARGDNLPMYARMVVAALIRGHFWPVWLMAQTRKRLLILKEV